MSIMSLLPLVVSLAQAALPDRYDWIPARFAEIAVLGDAVVRKLEEAGDDLSDESKARIAAGVLRGYFDDAEIPGWSALDEAAQDKILDGGVELFVWLSIDLRDVEPVRVPRIDADGVLDQIGQWFDDAIAAVTSED